MQSGMMNGNPDPLNEFALRIDPYLAHWRSLRVACLAARVGLEWVQFAGKAVLSTEPLEPNSAFAPIVDLDDFRAYHGCFEPKVIHNLIDNLRVSTIESQFAKEGLRLVTAGSPPYSWRHLYIGRKPSAESTSSEWPSLCSVHGAGSSSGSFPPPNVWLDLDTRLRRYSPPYNGLAALCGKLGLSFMPSGSGPHFNLYAELPAKFLGCEIKTEEKSLVLTMKYVGTPDLVVEWLPARETRRVPIPAGQVQVPAQYAVTLLIPPGAIEIKANLLVMECDADALSLHIGWGNTLLRICEFFDPGQGRLSDFLYKEISLKNVNPFELGVARLLGLAGYTVLWFGKGAKDALPDLVSYMRTPRGVEFIIYAECTLKNPAEKFSDFAKRADDLREHMDVETRSILPVVFVRNEVTDQDRQAAAELGLILCGGGEVTQLQEKIKSDAAPDEVFQFLASLGSDIMISGLLNSL
jgi:hypothetical protein